MKESYSLNRIGIIHGDITTLKVDVIVIDKVFIVCFDEMTIEAYECVLKELKELG